KGPPLLLYGWTFTDDWVLDWARKLKHTINLKATLFRSPGSQSAEVFHCADLKAGDAIDERLRKHVVLVTRQKFLKDLIKELGAEIGFESLLCSMEYDSMYVLWTNYNFAERQWILERRCHENMKLEWSTFMESMNEIMAEPGQTTKQPMWWYSSLNFQACAHAHPYIHIHPSG
ncbi:uncharacterized protein BXZ73DRAFT_52795, partial [Epithele typhae]|uniref:uncharacterized protein n=1 Tax=Epithele typhae TaxID=378194 RepID=UPI00200813AA